MTFPLHASTRATLRDLYVRNVTSALDRGEDLEAAKAGAREAAFSLRDHLADGTVEEMEDNVILAEMRRGIEPEEFRRGPVFHESLEVS